MKDKPTLSNCYKGGNSDGQPGYWIGFHYDADVVEALKAAVPHTHRRWNSETKLWWISMDYDVWLCETFGNFYALAHMQGSLFG